MANEIVDGKDINNIFNSFFYDGDENENIKRVAHSYYEGLCELISKMRYYQEENRVIQFRLAIGNKYYSKYSSLEDGKIPSRYCLCSKSFPCDYNSVSDEAIYKKIREYTYLCLKKVLPSCSDNTDIYILLSGNEKELIIETGLYFLELGKSQTISNQFLNSGFMLSECIPENKIVFYSKAASGDDMCNGINRKTIFLDLNRHIDQENDCVDFFSSSSKKSNDYYWRNVFERAKRNCHGTICLIVEPGFDIDDEDFTKLLAKKASSIGSDICIDSSSNSEQLRQSLQLFYSLLNYDGFTIIDTSGKVLAYNNIVALSEMNGITDSVEGDCGSENLGSRHAAFNTMKRWDASKLKLVAIYFQSQEGESEFFIYDRFSFGITDSANLYNSKDFSKYYVSDELFSIVNTNKSWLETLKKNININSLVPTPMDRASESNYVNFSNAVNNLLLVHRGIDNFYKEKSAVELLNWYFCDPTWKNVFISVIENDDGYKKLRKDSIDATLACIIGNFYGESRAAQEELKKLIEAIPFSWISEYFNENLYMNGYILEDLPFDKPYLRWNGQLKEYIYNLFEKNNQSKSSVKKAFELSMSDFARMRSMIFELEYDI